MNFSVKQFESSLKRVLKDAIAPIEANMVTKKEFNDLVVSIDSLTTKVDSFLNKEWVTHLHDIHPRDIHPRIESRLKRLEKKLSI